jgi:hypothetical protein
MTEEYDTKYVDKYINDNMDDIIDELNNEDDIVLDDCDKNNKDIINNYKEEFENNDKKIKQEMDDEQYYIDLINTFMIHYNNKYNKNENFFSNINNEKETNSQMEIFYESRYELLDIKEKLGYLNEIECMDYIFEKEKYSNSIKFKSLYCLELNSKHQLYTPALLIALNYIIINKLEEGWTIFNLEEY